MFTTRLQALLDDQVAGSPRAGELLARLELRDVTIAVRLWENEHDWAAYGAD